MDIPIRSGEDLGQLKMLMNDMIINYNASEHLFNLEKLNEYELTEHQFAQLIGRCRMYQNLPTAMKNEIAPMLYGDAQLNAVVRTTTVIIPSVEMIMETFRFGGFTICLQVSTKVATLTRS
ncbi:MAG: DUF3871 family protein [Bacteroidetes bacterium]|nr:DUF3871 family protein [Bacteroidota bacterium]